MYKLDKCEDNNGIILTSQEVEKISSIFEKRSFDQQDLTNIKSIYVKFPSLKAKKEFLLQNKSQVLCNAFFSGNTELFKFLLNDFTYEMQKEIVKSNIDLHITKKISEYFRPNMLGIIEYILVNIIKSQSEIEEILIKKDEKFSFFELILCSELKNKYYLKSSMLSSTLRKYILNENYINSMYLFNPQQIQNSLDSKGEVYKEFYKNFLHDFDFAISMELPIVSYQINNKTFDFVYHREINLLNLIALHDNKKTFSKLFNFYMDNSPIFKKQLKKNPKILVKFDNIYPSYKCDIKNIPNIVTKDSKQYYYEAICRYIVRIGDRENFKKLFVIIPPETVENHNNNSFYRNILLYIMYEGKTEFIYELENLVGRDKVIETIKQNLNSIFEYMLIDYKLTLQINANIPSRISKILNNYISEDLVTEMLVDKINNTEIFVQQSGSEVGQPEKKNFIRKIIYVIYENFNSNNKEIINRSIIEKIKLSTQLENFIKDQIYFQSINDLKILESMPDIDLKGIISSFDLRLFQETILNNRSSQNQQIEIVRFLNKIDPELVKKIFNDDFVVQFFSTKNIFCIEEISQIVNFDFNKIFFSKKYYSSLVNPNEKEKYQKFIFSLMFLPSKQLFDVINYLKNHNHVIKHIQEFTNCEIGSIVETINVYKKLTLHNWTISKISRVFESLKKFNNQKNSELFGKLELISNYAPIEIISNHILPYFVDQGLLQDELQILYKLILRFNSISHNFELDNIYKLNLLKFMLDEVSKNKQIEEKKVTYNYQFDKVQNKFRSTSEIENDKDIFKEFYFFMVFKGYKHIYMLSLEDRIELSKVILQIYNNYSNVWNFVTMPDNSVKFMRVNSNYSNPFFMDYKNKFFKILKCDDSLLDEYFQFVHYCVDNEGIRIAPLIYKCKEASINNNIEEYSNIKEQLIEILKCDGTVIDNYIASTIARTNSNLNNNNNTENQQPSFVKEIISKRKAPDDIPEGKRESDDEKGSVIKKAKDLSWER
ncbi:MAG: hypothetical protein ACK4OM_07140 [Alphaproteobacteria bacterium]